MNYIFAFIIGYLLGSFPTAYILLKRFKQLDITRNGSQNVGALNSYKVSQSKIIGIIVLFSDAFKGFLTVYILKMVAPDNFLIPAIGITAAVFAHCYSPWIKFKGGRGVATAAGGGAYLAPIILLLWGILWIIAYIYKRERHIGSIMATVLTLALVLSSSSVLSKYTLPRASNNFEFMIPVSLILCIIILKHWKPLLEWFGKQKVKNRDFENE